MKNITIAINTVNRSNNISTIHQFPKTWKEFTYLIVLEEEAKEYKYHYPSWNIVSMPEDIAHYLPPQRQWVMDNTAGDYIFFMDDDLTFSVRDDGLKMHKCEKSDMVNMLEMVDDCLSDFPMVGISTGYGNNRCLEDYANNTRITRCYCVDRKVFNKIGATICPFDDCVMEDFNLNLTFLENGKPNRVIYKYAQDDKGSNSDGGCSLYRTADVQKKSALWLHKQHPLFVTIKEKKTKGCSWKGFPVDAEGFVTRTDVIVHWKKAFESSKMKTKGILGYIK